MAQKIMGCDPLSYQTPRRPKPGRESEHLLVDLLADAILTRFSDYLVRISRHLWTLVAH